jgi:tRNA-dihydrouridine synthase B
MTHRANVYDDLRPVHPLVVGTLQLASNILLAPMAGVTDQPFRILSKAGGAGLVCTEMVSARALVYRNEKTIRLMAAAPQERPVSVQIFGGEPAIMAEAARMVEAYGADCVDINFGCPVRKIMKAGAGARLIDDIDRMAAIMEQVVRSVTVPVTVKIRIGREPGENVAPAIVRRAEQAGVRMVAVHARPASAGHAGEPDIAALAAAAAAAEEMPVIGNGGIVDPQTARRFLQAGCAGIMIGRAAIGDPDIFSRIAATLNGQEQLPAPSWEERIRSLKQHAGLAAAYYGEAHGMTLLRKVAGHYLKGLPNTARIRQRFSTLSTLAALDDALSLIWQSSYFEEAPAEEFRE